jgi:polyphosphate kinase 2 (PPK2 family)
MNGWTPSHSNQRALAILIDDGEFARQIAEIQRLEQMLCDEGVLILKYCFHLSRAQQDRRLRALRDDPNHRGRLAQPQEVGRDAYESAVHDVLDPSRGQ